MTNTERPAVVERWHRVTETKDLAALDALIADDAVFRSPVVFTPQEGKAATLAYLRAAVTVFGDGTGFHFVGEWYAPNSAVLEFVADLDGVQVNGVDMIEWDEHDRITRFTVMVRPIKGLQALIPRMAAQLGQA
ncbi:nuclear transport factor 2 family protein [Rhodococcus sp. HM1]|uniref:nuclear transport factor 2 family protein n=1 Tax=unclassified Rhodococcus (in: high G+C Gram-positive bacteria) TaxID=192944 RepID=UPI00200AAC41|nr:MULTISPECIES: nuclear transport factor 2 family protein [unclassified Rhodococcus (in: high G+C Gram-positive bacteria)]MCK8671097.1 nuclear transport factor 2 family protein [Rhodococcus sp. HM1]